MDVTGKCWSNSTLEGVQRVLEVRTWNRLIKLPQLTKSLTAGTVSIS